MEIKGRLCLSQLNHKSTAIHRKELVAELDFRHAWINNELHFGLTITYDMQCIIFRNAVLSKIWIDDILSNDGNVIMIKLECHSKLEERTYGMSWVIAKYYSIRKKVGYPWYYMKTLRTAELQTLHVLVLHMFAQYIFLIQNGISSWKCIIYDTMMILNP